MYLQFFLKQVLSLDKCIFGIVYPQRHLVAVFWTSSSAGQESKAGNSFCSCFSSQNYCTAG